MKVGIDFDRVLFDTDSFNDYLKEETGLHHVDADVYDENGLYSPEKHARACGVPVEQVYEAMEDLSKFLMEDVEKLEKLKEKHEVAIVTRGREEFQNRKIKGAGVRKLFDEILIVQDGSKDVDGIDFLIDDRKEEIEGAGIPGMVFDREKHGAEDIIREVNKRET